ncbi:MAG: VanW family protein [Bifidobacteriaceae bacterium]|jgi:vancomycin resistance protein YoaR|nr:VanW family protein [Bifidobacteriaceae bacterium]
MRDTTKMATEHPKRRLGRTIGFVIAAVLLVGAAVGYVWLANYLAKRVPAGVEVAGVDISRMTKPEAIAALEAELGTRATAEVEVEVDGATMSIDPAEAGLSFSPEKTIASQFTLTYDPFAMWRHVSGSQDIAPVTEIDQDKLLASLETVAEHTAVAPVDGTISVVNGTVETTDPVPGSRVDVQAAADAVTEAWFVEEGPVALPWQAEEPTVDQAALDRAKTQIAEPLLSGPVTIAVEDRRIELPVTVLTEAASIGPVEGTLRLNLNEDTIIDAVKERLPTDIESEAKNAQFVFVDGKPEIEPATAGRTVDFASITAEVAMAAQSSADRTAQAAMTEIDPAQSTQMLEDMGINEVVGSHHTQAYADAGRTANLQLAAEKVTGVLVPPGEVFSLNDTLGPRTAENGWHTAGVVENGVLTEGMGGGLSQFSTTLYNASHLAGMEDVEHQPHHNYFSRYPEGREATLWEGVIDNRFRNTTPYGVLIRAWVTSSLEVNVELWSTKYWEVESVIGPRRGVVPAKEIRKPAGPNCEEQAKGSPGFTVDYTRTLKLNGELKDEQTWTWTYAPTNAYVCEKPKPKKDSEEEDE